MYAKPLIMVEASYAIAAISKCILQMLFAFCLSMEYVAKRD